MDGILNLAKPKGPTSHDVIQRVRSAIGVKRVGHTGTLDPMAEGVLVVCIGKAARIAEYLVGCEKEYEADLVLGISTATQDAEGEIISIADASYITQESVLSVLPKFTGSILQVPPMVSAIKRDGKRLYELARNNIEVHREPREVTISLLEMTSFNFDQDRGVPIVGLRIVCSSGTYIRTLCSDIGDALGVGGHMGALIRTRVGKFCIQDSITLDELESTALSGDVSHFFISMKDALSDLPCIVIDDEMTAKVANGSLIVIRSDIADGELVRICSERGEFLAVGKILARGTEKFLKPEKVFVGAE